MMATVYGRSKALINCATKHIENVKMCVPIT